MLFKGSLKSFFTVLVCLVFGTGIGIFFQQFGATSQLFQNFVDVKFNISEIKLLFVQFGFMFGIKINLGTIFGGIAGILLSR